MKEIAPQKKLFRCVMAAALAVGLSLPSTGVFAYGNPEDATFDSLEVDDKVLGGLDAATDEEALPIEPAEGGEGQPSADGAPTPEESLDSEASDIVTGGGVSKSDEEQPSDSDELEAAAAVALESDGAELMTEGELVEPYADSEGFTDYSGLSIKGGAPGTDYALETVAYARIGRGSNEGTQYQDGRKFPLGGGTQTASISMLVIKSSGSYVIKNTNGTGSSVGVGIRVSPGVKADITFAGVNINGRFPMDIATNSHTSGNGTVEAEAGDISNPTTVHLTLADGTVNTLKNSAFSSTVQSDHSIQFPGLRCGEGSVLVVDDSVRNVDISGKAIVPDQGIIPEGVTYVNRDGETVTSTGKGKDLVSSLSNLESRNPGQLWVYSGIRSAAIGGGPIENSGDMTFNGGSLHAYSNDKGTTAEGSGNGSGAAIGGGHAGGGTSIVFNGGTVDAYASYHGAAIGGGCTYTGGMSTSYNTWPLRDALISRTANHTIAGDITINGGYVEAWGAHHSNAFGQGCGGTNTGKTILITGGTLLPHWGGNSSFLEIGGTSGFVIITGGSVNCTRFQGNDNDGLAYGDVDRKTKVGMITIDVTSKIQAAADAAGVTADLNARMESWELLLNQKLTDPRYGAPARLNNGKLYLWLPKGTNEKNQIDANFSYYVGDRLLSSKTTLPEGSVGGGDATPKEWNIFELDENFVRENWSKYYDGKELEPVNVDPDKGGTAIPVTDPDGGKLDKNDFISYYFWQTDENGETVGSASTSDSTPADAGAYNIEVRSSQYKNQSPFSDTYWGHAATGSAVISPVTSKTSWNLTEPVKLELTDDEGNKVVKEYTGPTWAQDENAGNFNTATNNHLVVPVDIASDKLPFGDTYPDGSSMSKTTCKAPTGRLQLYIDGRAVPQSLGGVIEFDRTQLEDSSFERAWVAKDATGREHTVAYFNLTRGQLEAFGLEDKSAEGNEHYVYVEYTSARAGSEPRDDAAGASEASVAAMTMSVQARESWKPAHNDSAYVNYYESANESAPVEIELAIPDFRLFNEKGTGYIPNDDSAANVAKLKLDDATERDWVDPATKEPRGKQEQTDVSQFRDVVDENTGAVTEARQDWFPLYVQTNSIGDVVFSSSNPDVIQIEPNEFTSNRVYVDGKTDYGVGASAKVVSAGKTTITATIKGTGAYSSVSKSFDVYVFPDLAKEPELTMTETAYDMSRVDGTIRPGDTLRYIVTATNQRNDTACINPNYELGVPADTEFAALTIVDPEGHEVKADYELVGDKVTIRSLPTLFGGQSYRFKLDVTVKPDVVKKAEGEKPELLSHSKVSGVYGINPDAFEWDNRIDAENGVEVTPAEAEANPTLPPSPDEPTRPAPDPIVPDGGKATEILGGELQDPEPVNPDEPEGPDNPKKPGVPVGPVEPGSPFDTAVEADPDDPTKPAPPVDPDADPSDPEGQPPKQPIKEGDVIVKFGDKDDPESPDDIASELDEQIKKKLEEDPEADHVDIPVTIERPNPDDPAGDPIREEVIVTVPITPEMRPDPVDPDDRNDHDLIIVPGDVDPRPSGDIVTEKTAENVTPGFAERPNRSSALVGDRVRFTVSVKNTKPGSAYYDVVVKDPLPQGLAYVPGSTVVVDSSGKEHRGFEADWNEEARTIGFCLGDVPGPGEASVSFECLVTGEALFGNGDLSNVAVALGTQPSETLPTPDPDNPTSGPIVIDRDPTPPGPYNPEDHGTTWDEKEKDVIDEIRDVFPDIPEDEEIVIPPSRPADPGTASPSDPKLVDDEEGPADIKLVKSAENLDRGDGSTHVGDTVRYTVVVSNAKQYSMWYDAVVRDKVPEGLEVLEGTIKLTDADGRTSDVADSAYDARSRVLAVSCGDLRGGASVTVTFDVLVTEDAVGRDVGNTATAYGTLPSTREPGTSGITPGTPFVPSDGWESFIEAHPGVSNPNPVYPSADVNASGGVIGSADDDKRADGKKDRTLLHLAQTGDATKGALAIAIACVAAFIALLARRQLGWRWSTPRGAHRR